MSKIATSIDQGKRLLAAGIDPKSADMRWETFPGCVPHLCYQQDLMPLIPPKVTPAWSLSRLIDMNGPFQCDVDGSDELMEYIVDALIFRLQHK